MLWKKNFYEFLPQRRKGDTIKTKIAFLCAFVAEIIMGC